MTIKLTNEQYDIVRTALITAQVSIEDKIQNAKAENKMILVNHYQNQLEKVEAGLRATHSSQIKC